jgi:hypothetical protein
MNLMSSQYLEEFAKDDDTFIHDVQDKEKNMAIDHMSVEVPQGGAGKKVVAKGSYYVEGTKKYGRCEIGEDVKIVDKATTRAKTKVAFLSKGTSSNPFSLINVDNELLIDIYDKLRICLGVSFVDVVTNLELIKSLLLTRNNLVAQSVKKRVDSNDCRGVQTDVDSNIHEESATNFDYELKNVMVLRKDRKSFIRKISEEKKEASPKLRYTPTKRSDDDFAPLSPFKFRMIDLVGIVKGWGKQLSLSFLRNSLEKKR